MKITHSWVILEPFRPTLPVNAGKTDPKLSERTSQHNQEILVLRENNWFRPWVVLTDPQDMPSQSVNLRAKRSIEVNILDLTQRGIADIGIDRRLAALRELLALRPVFLFLYSETLWFKP